jgi:hypothetical protein
MRPRWRLQFGLRTLLIAALLLPPIIAVQYRRWRDDRIWRDLSAAKERRDASLVAWRRTFEAVHTGKAAPLEELAAQTSYYAARQDVESAMRSLHARYGSSDQDLLRAMQARQRKK